MKWLSLTEFAYNNSCHVFIKKSSFHLVYGLDSRMNFLDSSEYGAANLDSCSRADQLRDQHAQAKKSLVKAQVYQKKYYNKKHIVKTYREENKV